MFLEICLNVSVHYVCTHVTPKYSKEYNNEKNNKNYTIGTVSFARRTFPSDARLTTVTWFSDSFLRHLYART